MISDEMKLLLRTNQLIIRDRRWASLEYFEQAKVIDGQITDILKPKEQELLEDRTKDVLRSK